LAIKTNTADAVPIFGFFRYVADPDGEAVLEGDRIKYWSKQRIFFRMRITTDLLGY
jgi:hypothetical protein